MTASSTDRRRGSQPVDKKKLRGDNCPTWCGGVHKIDRDGPTHPDDAGVWHEGPAVDRWTPDGADEAIEVRVEGYRHDQGKDWPDDIRATNVSPGYLSEVCLNVPDARRLGEALLLACDLVEGKGQVVSAIMSTCPAWCKTTASEHGLGRARDGLALIHGAGHGRYGELGIHFSVERHEEPDGRLHDVLWVEDDVVDVVDAAAMARAILVMLGEEERA